MNELIIRPAKASDAAAIIKAHRDAIREKAAAHYPPEIIGIWAHEATEDRILQLQQEISDPAFHVVVAEAEGAVIGFGTVIPGKKELRAVYARKNPYGAGQKMLERLLAHAKERGVGHLEMHSSINAEGFYERNGFQSLGRDVHYMGPERHEMACVKMRIDL